MLKIIQHKKDIDMKQTRLLFIDRDGTLIQEPEDEQIDSFEKLVFTKGVMRNLSTSSSRHWKVRESTSRSS